MIRRGFVLRRIMSTKFFNNGLGNTLFDKLKGIASGMATFDRFLAVVGFFRSSGYFKLRKELGDISEIKILVGINIDDIFRKHNKALLMLADEDKAKEIYNECGTIRKMLISSINTAKQNSDKSKQL